MATGLLAARPAVAAEAAVAVELVDHDGLTAAVTAAKGTVVVLDCWSTSCPPCVKEFPGLVALHRKHGAAVTCMSLSLDYEGIGKPEEVVPPVKAFLEQQKAVFRNMLAKEDSDAMCKKLGIVSVPAVFVWDRDGKLAKKFDDDIASKSLGRPFTYADIEAVV
ncbi:MAG: TlpA family protein disulfide reductase, partial [Actinobacteria bacterium]|nr:TlpA family protein disulfide reductase [Actinomycetota bacterium]